MNQSEIKKSKRKPNDTLNEINVYVIVIKFVRDTPEAGCLPGNVWYLFYGMLSKPRAIDLNNLRNATQVQTGALLLCQRMARPLYTLAGMCSVFIYK